MANSMQWTPHHSVGDASLDEQHRRILAQCESLASYCRDEDDEHDRQFRALFGDLMALVREHFAAEVAFLLARAYPDMDGYRHEIEEFEYLVAEIVTPENFDKIELQRFLSLWWGGHVIGLARQLAMLPRS